MPGYRPVVNSQEQVMTGPKSGRLLRNVSIVSLMTLLSRILGFLRDVVLASTFGAGIALDSWVVAFRIPNFFRRLFGEGAFSQAFVPVLSELRARESQESVAAFISRIWSALFLVLAMLVAIAEVFATTVVMIFAHGFIHDPARFTLTVHMLRITFPYIILISMTALSGAVLNTHQRFALPAFAPVLLNIALISVALWWAPHSHTPIIVLAWGVIIGGFFQLAIQLPALARLGCLPRLRWGFRDPYVRQVLRLMVPALFGVSVAQLSLLIDNCFASFLPAGSISWLYFSDRLTYLPLGLFGVAIATVILPSLSRAFSQNQERFGATIDWGIETLLLVGLPAAVGLWMLSGSMISVLFQHGDFSAFDVAMTQRSLKAYAIGLPAFMLIKVLASAFYSQKKVHIPVRVAAFALLVNVIGNFVLIGPLAHAGLALSTSIAASVNALLLVFLLLRKRMWVSKKNWLWPLTRLLLANSGMALWLLLVSRYQLSYFPWFVAHHALLLLLKIGCAMLIYFFLMTLFGWRVRELKR